MSGAQARAAKARKARDKRLHRFVYVRAVGRWDGASIFNFNVLIDPRETALRISRFTIETLKQELTHWCQRYTTPDDVGKKFGVSATMSVELLEHEPLEHLP